MNSLAARLLESAGPPFLNGERWAVKIPSNNWKIAEAGIWLNVTNGQIPSFGWKVHVSALLAEATSVLKVTSSTAFEVNCPFKFLSGVNAYLSLHSKSGSRLQSGKFIALYPPSEDDARGLMDRLKIALSPYRGLDILTDRAYKNSSNVFYRWGAFKSTGRLNNEGEPEELVPNGKGEMVPDLRAPFFFLPGAIVDPFSDQPAISGPSSSPNSMSFDRFTIESVLRFTNAGGRYKATCQLTGAEVVIKEARPDTGYIGFESAIPRLRREANTQKYINAASPGLAPKVLKEFSVQGHQFVAIEYLPGTPLSEWIARENPLYSSLYLSTASIGAYFRRASKILEKIRDDLGKLHDSGLAYGDLSPGNIIVNEEDFPRFIDFESCTSVDDMAPPAATPDFCLLRQAGELSARERDLYAYNCIAISLVLRITTLAEISDHVLSALRKELTSVTRDIPRWWTDACDNVKTTTQKHSPNKVIDFEPPALNTAAWRAAFRESICSGILGSYTATKEYQFPSSNRALKGAFLSFNSGSGGVLRALKSHGCKIDADMMLNYATSVDSAIEKRLLPLGYDYGLAGILETCTTFGLADLGERIIDVISREWTHLTDPSLAAGLTGVALALFRQGRIQISEEIMARALLMTEGYFWRKNGLLNGRSGVVAGACQFHSLLRSQPKLAGLVGQIISQEFGQTVRHPKGISLSLRGERDGSRLLPYLSDGTAGFLLSLILASEDSQVDYALTADDTISLAADLGTPFMLEASLMDGAAGLAVILEILRCKFPELTDQIPDPAWDRIRKYFLPLNSGIGLLNPRSLKFDLSHAQGSAGVLEALLWVDGISALNLSGLHLAPGVLGAFVVPHLF